MKNGIALTFDIEFFEHSRGFKESSLEDGIIEHEIFKKGLKKIFYLLEKCDSNFTFFVVSEIAKKNPEVVKKLAQKGHEIASHSERHLRGKEGVKECKNSKSILEKVSGQEVFGYRAPALQAKKKFLKEIGGIGFKYDSSLVPSIRIPGWFSGKFFKRNIIEKMKGYKIDKIFELPPSVNPYLRVPISGFFFRFFPFKYIEWTIKSLLKKDVTPIIYLHPWELVNLSKLKKIPWRTRVGTGNNLIKKLKKLLNKKHNYKTMFEIYKEKSPKNH